MDISRRGQSIERAPRSLPANDQFWSNNSFGGRFVSGPPSQIRPSFSGLALLTCMWLTLAGRLSREPSEGAASKGSMMMGL